MAIVIVSCSFLLSENDLFRWYTVGFGEEGGGPLFCVVVDNKRLSLSFVVRGVEGIGFGDGSKDKF